MIEDHLARFQSDILEDGSLEISGFWRRVAKENPGDDPLIGPLEQKLSASYPSLTEADQKALAFPAFPTLASQFTTAPFTTIAALLWELRKVQEQALAEAKEINGISPFPAPPFEGAP